MSNYRDLRVYQLAEELDDQIFVLSGKFPRSEIYGLTDQLKRSIHSIVANIAEGYGRRFYPQEYARFLTFSQASSHESREHLKAALKRKYCTQAEFFLLDDKLDHVGKMLTLLIKKVQKNGH